MPPIRLSRLACSRLPFASDRRPFSRGCRTRPKSRRSSPRIRRKRDWPFLRSSLRVNFSPLGPRCRVQRDGCHSQAGCRILRVHSRSHKSGGGARTGALLRSIHSIVIYPRNAANAESDVTLEPLNYGAFRTSMEEMGFKRDDIERRSHESGRSLTVLRRRLSRLPANKLPNGPGANRLRCSWCLSCSLVRGTPAMRMTRPLSRCWRAVLTTHLWSKSSRLSPV